MDNQLLLIAQAQAAIASFEIDRLQIEAEGKWYEADWREGSSTKVYRVGGKFASPGAAATAAPGSESPGKSATDSEASKESNTDRLTKSLNLTGENTQEKAAQVQRALDAFGIDTEGLIKECDRIGEGQLDAPARKAAIKQLEAKRKEQIMIASKASINAIKLAAKVSQGGEQLVSLEQELSNNMIASAAAVQEKEHCESLIAQYKGEGFSLGKRVNELAEIVEKEGADSPRAQWRAGVVKASIKYDANIDAVANAELGSDEQKVAYENLLRTATKESPGTIKTTQSSTKDFAALAAMFSSLGGLSLKTYQERFNIIDAAAKELKSLSKLINSSLNIKLTVSNNRAFAIGGSKTKSGQTLNRYNNNQINRLFDFFNSDGIINVGDVNSKAAGLNTTGYEQLSNTEDHLREIAFHEAGHLIEMKYDLVDMSAALREDRAAETPKGKAVKLPYGMSQVGGSRDAAEDRFFSPYQGLRMKSPDGSQDLGTEVLSSGFESLGSSRLAGRMAAKDRETMLYALSVADMKPNKR
jgi:hypothetical protein